MTTLRRIGLTVDCAIIALVLVSLWRILGVGVASSAARTTLPKLIEPGTQLNLPGVRWDAAARHAVVRILTTCPACNDSASFYQEASRRIRFQANTQLTLIVTEPDEAVQRWLDINRIRPHHIVKLDDPSALGFLVIPTVLLVDSAGVVTDVLVERLSADTERRFLERLAAPATGPSLNNTYYAEEIEESEVAHRITRSQGLILDIRDRDAFAKDHRDGAINIPSDELEIRAREELPSAAPIIVDCWKHSAGRCRTAGRKLKKLGFSPVMLTIR